LDLFYEEEFQPPFFSNFDGDKDMIGLEKDFCDESFCPFSFSPLCSTIDMVGIFPHDIYFPMGQSCFQPMVHCKGFSVSYKANNPWVGRQMFFLVLV
jgi:hypothetical protein